jgi:hypothetical protein
VSSEASPTRERDDRERSRLERILPELVKKLVDVGMEKLTDGPESLRQMLSEMKLPKEAILLLGAQVDETKKDIVRGLARELREFLERASLADEITRLLSGLTLEVKTQIRFVPNSSPSGGRSRPEIKTKVGMQVESSKSPDDSEPIRESGNAIPNQDGSHQVPNHPNERNTAEQERPK